MEFLEVARIIKPHGLAGEVGVLMHWADSAVLECISTVRLQRGDGTTSDHRITRIRPSGRGYLVTLAGVESRDAAEALRDARILIDRAELPAAEPGEAYLADLVGRSVFGPDGEWIGRIVEISSYPSVDSLVIERSDGSRLEQPLVDDWVQPLDAGTDRVILRSLDGLISS